MPGEASLISFSYLLLLSLIKSSKLRAKLKSANLLSVGNTTRKLNRRRRSNLGCSYRSVLVIRGKELLRFFPGQNFAKDSDSEKKFKFLYLYIYISLQLLYFSSFIPSSYSSYFELINGTPYNRKLHTC